METTKSKEEAFGEIIGLLIVWPLLGGWILSATLDYWIPLLRHHTSGVTFWMAALFCLMTGKYGRYTISPLCAIAWLVSKL